MEQEDIKRLAAQLRKFGREDNWESYLTPYLHTDKRSIVMRRYEFRKGDRISYSLHLHKNRDSGAWEFPSFFATLRKGILVEHTIIKDIDTRKLEEKMNGIDWNLDYSFIAERGLFLGGGIERIKADMAESALTKLQQLIDSGPQGRAYAEALMVKFFADTPNEKRHGVRELKKVYEQSNIFYVNGETELTTVEVHGILSGRAVYKQFLDANGTAQAGWLKMGPRLLQTRKAAKGIFFSGQELYPPFDFGAELKGLSLRYSRDYTYDDLVIALRQGDNPYATFNGKDFFLIAVNPELKGFDFFSSPGKLLPLNELSKPIPRPQKKLGKGRSNGNKH